MDGKQLEDLEQRYRELQMVCEVWVAANDAKDKRIAELEEQLEQMRQRVSRLGRLVARHRRDEPRKARHVR
jgi:archaellum component FlaC